MVMDRDPSVVSVRSQPFQFHLAMGRHVPDFRRADGSAVVIDVRPDTLVTDEDQVIFDATRKACGLAGWSYSRVGELDPIARANHRWLANFRHSRCSEAGVRWELLQEALSVPMTICRLAASCGADPVVVLPHIYHRLWRGDLVADESELLSSMTTVQLREAR